MELVFENPRFLYFLLFVPLLIFVHYAVLRLTKKQAIPFANFQVLSRISEKYVFAQNNIQLLIRIGAIVFVCFALSGAAIYIGVDEGFAPNTVFLVDASESMLIQYDSGSSWTQARDLIESYARQNVFFLSGVGLLTFSTVTVPVSPVVNSFTDFSSSMEYYRPHNVAGTALDTALFNGLFVADIKKGTKRVVMITDGKGAFGPNINQVLQYAENSKTIIDFVLIQVPDPNLQVINSMRQISAATGGEVHTLVEIELLVEHLLEKDSTEIYLDLTSILLIATLAVMTLEWALSKSIYKTVPHEA